MKKIVLLLFVCLVGIVCHKVVRQNKLLSNANVEAYSQTNTTSSESNTEYILTHASMDRVPKKKDHYNKGEGTTNSEGSTGASHESQIKDDMISCCVSHWFLGKNRTCDTRVQNDNC